MKGLLSWSSIVLGIACSISAGPLVSAAPSVSYLVGTLTPGILFLILGLMLSAPRKPSSSQVAESGADPSRRAEASAEALKFSAIVGITSGVSLFGLGTGIVPSTENRLLASFILVAGGWAWLIWGCMSWVRWKGYSGWFGLFGYLLLLGLIVLAFFPHRPNGALSKRDPQGGVGEGPVSRGQREGWIRFLLMLVPLGVLMAAFCVVFSPFGYRIDPAEWKKIDSPDAGFQALMPGTPRVEHKTQETPNGTLEVDKFTLLAKGRKKELFMVAAIRFPNSVAAALGSQEGLLEVGRKDAIAACRGELKSEKRILLSGQPGLELELLPRGGSAIRSRVYAISNRVYQVSAYVSKIRASSDDVQHFLDSFQLNQP